MLIDVPRALLLRAIHALEEQAHHLAALSCVPNLFGPEDTQQWGDAQKLRALLRQPKSKLVSGRAVTRRPAWTFIPEAK